MKEIEERGKVLKHFQGSAFEQQWIEEAILEKIESDRNCIDANVSDALAEA
ncbi:MAG: hypothetical protein KDK78_00855 [Chlamydiia bacterium]|nr:hypothetical protein [Chlamydiia bacterium]